MTQKEVFMHGKTMLLIAALAFAPAASAQEPDPNETVPRREKRPPAPPAAGDLKLTASLVDADKNGAARTAVVQAAVDGLELVDPASVNEQARDGQGHLHYQLDNGPLIATTNTKMSFHELSSGAHSVTVSLVGNDHAPLGPQQTLTVHIP
jgi:hypothetical protein